MKITCSTVLPLCLFNRAGSAAADMYVSVPGDTNEDKLISAEELKNAEIEHKDRKMSSIDPEKIKLIHESHPRIINDMASKEITIYRPRERIAISTVQDYAVQDYAADQGVFVQ